MAHRPMVRPDPFEPRRVIDEPPSSGAAPPKQRKPQAALDHVAITPAGAQDAASRQNQDEFLARVAEQACLATAATASAIALREGDDIICRATAGPNAPDLGVRINTSSGLSGACVRAREAQYCEDTENDARVNAAACRVLRVRSVLGIPLLGEGEVQGIFEIFSPLPKAFAKHDLQNLEALGRTLLVKLHGTQQAATQPSATTDAETAKPAPAETKAVVQPEPISKAHAEPDLRRWPDFETLVASEMAEAKSDPLSKPEEPPVDFSLEGIPEIPLEPAAATASAELDSPPAPVYSTAPEPPAPADETSVPVQTAPAEPQPRDWTTGVLTILVIGMALLLGWMLGRVGWQYEVEKKAGEAAAASAAHTKATQPRSNSPAGAANASDVAKVESGATGRAASGSSPPSTPPAEAVAQPKDKDDEASNGGLVVYEGGKIIFRQGAVTNPGDASGSTGGNAAQPGGNTPGATAVLLDPQTAGTHLLKRVDPVYPEDARRSRLEGEVVVEALVSKTGAVDELELISGDSRLATAAADAIRQWRFRPYTPRGKAINFRTRLMINFRLPPA